MLARHFERVVVYEDAYMRGRQPGEITGLITQGVADASPVDRPVEVHFGGTWAETAALVLDAAAPGDLILLQPDTIEQTIPWLHARYGTRLRESTFDELGGAVVVGPHDRHPATGEPVEVRPGRLGRGIHASRPIAAGEKILRAWGPIMAKRSRHTMQVDASTHVLPDGVIVHANHSCEPNCVVRIRAGEREIVLEALRPLAAGEELTVDYDTFEYEVEHLGGPCRCGAAACRGRVTGYKHLSAEVKARCSGLVADYLRAMDTEVPLPYGA
jgi:hypothetical protein